MHPRSALLLGLSVTLAGCALGCAPVRVANTPAGRGPETTLGAGCAPDRPAIAHHAGGGVVKSPRGAAPIPCSTATGFRSSEVSVGLTKAGTLMFQPAVPASGFPVGLIRSVDKGETWSFVLPSAFDDPPRITPVDQDLTVDPRTGRIFWVMGSPGAKGQVPRLDISDDDGVTWVKSSGPILPVGHSFIFVGPPTKTSPSARAYPNLVYVCHGSGPQKCQKSADGGMTFDAGVSIPIPPDAGKRCGNFGLRGVAHRNGTLYVPNTPCQLPYVAISHDEGATWQQVRIANVETIGAGNLSLDMDRQGNLYAAWVAANDRLPYVSVSRDRGLRWSTPLMIAAPGVKEAALPHLVAGASGHVAISYYGSQNSPGVPFPASCPGRGGYVVPGRGYVNVPFSVSTSCQEWQNVTWNTYITTTWDALATQPLLWSAPLNDPVQPTWYGCSPSPLSGAGAGAVCTAYEASFPAWGRLDYYGAAMGTGDTPWIGFVQACPNGRPVPGNPHCPSTLTGSGPDSMWGMVGRLVRAGGARKDEH